MRAGKLTSDQIEVMLLLREGKYRYRNLTDNPPATNFSFGPSEARQACFAILSEAVDIIRGGATNWVKLSQRDYWSERLVERAILNNEHDDDVFMSKIKHHNYNKRSLKSDISRIVQLHTSSS